MPVLPRVRAFFLFGCIAFCLACAQTVAAAEKIKRDPVLDAEADAALSRLLSESAEADDLARQAEAVLIFPSVARIGIWMGAEQGFGVLRVGSDVDGYYKAFSLTFGVQGGFQTYGYVIFFLTPEALKTFKSSERYELGANGSVAIADVGATADTEPSRPRPDTRGFIFDEVGLMAGAAIKVSTITRLDE